MGNDADTLPSFDSVEMFDRTALPRTPCATIGFHPDVARIGARRLLLGSSTGAPIRLARSELTFVDPARPGDEPLPLNDPYLSREVLPIVVRRDGGLDLDLAPAHGARVDGEPRSTPVSLRAEQLEHGVTLELAKRVVLWLHRTHPPVSQHTHSMVGASPALDAVRLAISNVADLDSSVLIRGETGVGKDHVARAIHAASGATGPYVAINMATIGPTTAASELFGHVRGAFTGARAAHAGVFERADGGTLFLDEVGDLAPDVQTMLLRTLETGRILPLGASAERAVSVRVVAATDANLDALVAAGRFRPALLHRLGAFQIPVPPLRERREDIPRLALSFLRREMEALGALERLRLSDPKARPWLHRSIMVQLLRADWPGNVRQLRNVIRQLAIASRGSAHAQLDAANRALLVGRQDAEPEPESAAMSSWQVQPPHHPAAGRHRGLASDVPAPAMSISPAALLSALEQHEWSFGAAARALGLNRTTFYRLVEDLPGVRKGSDLSARELGEARDAAGGDLAEMSAQLKVSRRAIRRRMKELGVALTPSG